VILARSSVYKTERPMFLIIVCFFSARQQPVDQGLLSQEVSRSHTQRLTSVGRTSQDERSARRRNLYLTTHNNKNRQTSIPPVSYEPKPPASDRPQNYALDHADKKPAFNILICIICVMC
jgi:hypothetical protein